VDTNRHSLDQARAFEHAKYVLSYEMQSYRMGDHRMADAVRDLQALPCRGAYLDVSCGRGEMLNHAEAPVPPASSPPAPIPDTSIYDVAAVHEIGRREGLRIIAIRRTDT
jgi:hypothetical protein